MTVSERFCDDKLISYRYIKQRQILKSEQNEYPDLMSNSSNQWRIYIVKFWTRAPPGVQILSISCSFWENLAKLCVGAPPGELAPPPRGNPGSATAETNIQLETAKKLYQWLVTSGKLYFRGAHPQALSTDNNEVILK